VNTYVPIAAPGFQRVPNRVNKTGWIVGVGSEYALLGGLSVKSEFLYANFGTIGSYDGVPAVNNCASCVGADVKMHEYLWRVGMHYRFDWASWGKGKAPVAVVAKY
jgi:opacity protein-like surface antigen